MVENLFERARLDAQHMTVNVIINRWASLTLVIVAGISPLCGAESDPRSACTLEMVERLREIDARMDVRANPYENPHRAFLFGAEARAATNDADRLNALRRYAIELLNAGASREAVVAFNEVEKLEDQLQVTNKEDRRLTRMYLGTAWLRFGEQQNCLTNHTIESCLLPLRGGGVHQLQQGSREAIEVFRSVLETEPEERFAADYDIHRFTDVAGDLGLDNNDLSGGTILDDFNNDGLLDVMVTAIGGRSQMRYFQNRGNGSFEDRTEAAGLLGLTRGLNLIQGDYNNGGFVEA